MARIDANRFRADIEAVTVAELAAVDCRSIPEIRTTSADSRTL
jgi:hypothetical protein